MRHQIVWTGIIAAALLCAAAPERLYNGIVLDTVWPPKDIQLTREPMRVPYLANPPAVIPIDQGRQLLVDDFLIQETTLRRTYHRPRYYGQNPIIKPDRPWENEGPSPFAGPFSGGVWYDHQDRLFKMWYICGYIKYTCYATSSDGMRWVKPSLDVVPGTNIVIDHGKDLKAIADGRPWMGKERRWIDTNSVWIDDGDDPSRRFKIFYTTWSKDHPEALDDWRLVYRYSRDGIHWPEQPAAVSQTVGDHTNVHYNPFRRKWVVQVRYNDKRQGRARGYVESGDPAEATRLAGMPGKAVVVPWLAADGLDPHNPNPSRADIAPQLYQFDTIAYESLMLGFFSIWQGPENQECNQLHIQKRNEVLAGFSRDGFHYDRPDRRPYFAVNEKPGAWNWGNAQSAAGAVIVVGDQLYLYFTARDLPADHSKLWDGYLNTGLAFLRRDGFASLDSTREEGVLSTRPVRFSGKYLFVNANVAQGELRAEALDRDGRVIAPFTRDNCRPARSDRTSQRISWNGADLGSLAGKPVQLRFFVRLGELYSFWVSADANGASGGYVGAGGPGYAGFRDTIGEPALSSAP